MARTLLWIRYRVGRGYRWSLRAPLSRSLDVTGRCQRDADWRGWAASFHMRGMGDPIVVQGPTAKAARQALQDEVLRRACELFGDHGDERVTFEEQA